MPQPTAAFTLMVQGTTSDAGKSAFVTGLCRVLQRRGYRVAPFKSQNMALNSAVSAEGGEIGRAQAVQAQACRIAPSIHMNPVLLKPSTDIGAQVIVQGKVFANMEAQVYHHHKPALLAKVLESFHYLTERYEAVIIEGAGSPAEINLRDRDIANMGFAEEADVPVIIIADIDKGGVFAHLYGTLALLSPSEQARVKGFVINRFRGDISLLQSGLEWLEQTTGKLVFGVLPYLHNLHLEAEDAISAAQITGETQLNVVVPVLDSLPVTITISMPCAPIPKSTCSLSRKDNRGRTPIWSLSPAPNPCAMIWPSSATMAGTTRLPATCAMAVKSSAFAVAIKSWGKPSATHKV